MANIATAGATFFSGGGSGSSEVSPAEIAASISALKGAVPGVELGAEENGNNGINAPPVIMNYCDGEWVKSSSGKYLPVRDPSTGLVSCQVFRSNAADVDAAVDAADRAKTGWANTPANQRAELLERVANMLRERIDDLAQCERYVILRRLYTCIHAYSQTCRHTHLFTHSFTYAFTPNSHHSNILT